MPTRHLTLSIIIAAAVLSAGAFAAAPLPGAATMPAAAATSVREPAALPPGATPVHRLPAPPTWTFPAPLKGEPPVEIWLPHPLSDEDKQHRTDATRALMIAERIDSEELTNAGILQDELKGAQYGDMQTELDALLRKFLADPTYEIALQAAATFAEQPHAHGFFPDTALLDAWVKARPNSAWARFARGLRWSEDAWKVRGEGWAKDVSDSQWKEMHEDQVKAIAEVDAALKIQPKLSIAWVQLLAIDETEGDLPTLSADFNLASKAVPTSFVISSEYEEGLEPRWLGSAAMMDDFAQSKLADLDKNPRFWYLQGDAVADSGCAACNDFHWDLSLKQYNAALAYADRPTWLEFAGKAALHLHRYALAYAYYDRAIAMKSALPYDQMYMDFARERCDPTQSADQIELYRKDTVMYGGMDNEEYPLGPDACAVYVSELPWGDQPLPDTSGITAYVINSLSHPTYTKQPLAMVNPSLSKPLSLPDGRWSVTVTQGDDKVSHVLLHDQKTGKETEIYSALGNVMMAFNSAGTRLFLSDWITGKSGGCRYYDPARMQGVDLKPKILQWIAEKHLAVTLDSVKVTCAQFINDDVLATALSGLSPDGKQVFHMFAFDAVSGRLVSTMD